jgi:hypothetical protein
VSLLDRVLYAPGSTRAVSLVRIAWALLVWTEFGATFRLHSSIGDPLKLGLSFVVWTGSTAMLLGFRSRWAAGITGAALAASWIGLGEIGGDDHFRRHHVYTLVIVSLMLAATPCGGSFSLDRLRIVRDARAAGAPVPPERGDLWATHLVQLQVAAMYLWAAWDKSSPAFHQRMEMYTSDFYFGAEHPGPWYAVVMGIAGYGAVALEYVLPFALWWPRTRTAALLAGVLFHAVVYWTLAVATYTCSMFVLYMLFVDPEHVHRTIDELLGRESPEPEAVRARTPGSS